MGIGLNKIKNREGFVNRESYNLFIEKNKDSKITYEQYILILKNSLRITKQYILENPLGFKMPNNLGYITVCKYKPKTNRTPIDWVASKKLGKHVPLTNLHTFGYMYSINLYANPTIHSIKNYQFVPHRKLKRELGAQLKSGFNQHIHVDKSYFSRRFNIDNLLNK